MALTASRLRQDIYRILDQVLETGVPVEVLRKGKIIRIVAPEPADRLDRLSLRQYLRDDPEDYVSIDWSGEWAP